MYISETPYHYLETSDPTWLIFIWELVAIVMDKWILYSINELRLSFIVPKLTKPNRTN